MKIFWTSSFNLPTVPVINAFYISPSASMLYDNNKNWFAWLEQVLHVGWCVLFIFFFQVKSSIHMRERDGKRGNPLVNAKSRNKAYCWERIKHRKRSELSKYRAKVLLVRSKNSTWHKLSQIERIASTRVDTGQDVREEQKISESLNSSKSTDFPSLSRLSIKPCFM